MFSDAPQQTVTGKKYGTGTIMCFASGFSSSVDQSKAPAPLVIVMSSFLYICLIKLIDISSCRRRRRNPISSIFS
ncbi:hypothetical protein KIN20_019326 [Parelaphostrongylus tenuis]|uniref:Uncharacterized protein n=1 Tax=Parelaphostrongylus tenuis TaxID=148309 RepID=A0AAD5QQ62_PARTN|nr:hypothetical protein KIN20_019326 [Parelaphostrongylus tenuis]